jgi:hypothetical protein
MALNLFYRRLTQEDLQDAPKGGWKEKLLYSLNLFMQQVYSLLNNGLTPEVNCIVQTKTFQLTGNSTPANNVYTFAALYSYYPLGYDLLNVQPTDGSSPVFSAAPFISWNFLNGNINILGISGLATGVTYTFTVRFWWAQVSNQ